MHVCMSCLLVYRKPYKNTLFVHLLHKSNTIQEITPNAIPTDTMDIIANEMVSEYSREVSQMVREILDVPEGSHVSLPNNIIEGMHLG